MLRAEVEPTAVTEADHERDAHLAGCHVPNLGNLVGRKVMTHRQEITEHDLRDGP
jgi:hypothetical protein